MAAMGVPDKQTFVTHSVTDVLISLSTHGIACLTSGNARARLMSTRHDFVRVITIPDIMLFAT